MDLKLPLLASEETQNPSNSKRKYLKIGIFSAIFISLAIILILILALPQSDKKIIVVKADDKRQFEMYSLSNGLETLTIHNITTPFSYSYVSISLPVGLLHDGEIQGLTHLVEHMSFYSSQKYLNKNNLFAFIQQNEGAFNAYTSYQETNYYYLIKNDSLFQSLDILGSFLLAPSLQEQDIINEVNVIEEEWHYRVSIFS